MKSIDWRSNRIIFKFYLGFDKADELYDTGEDMPIQALPTFFERALLPSNVIANLLLTPSKLFYPTLPTLPYPTPSYPTLLIVQVMHGQKYVKNLEGDQHID